MEGKNKILKNRQEKGITLIALVITIVVMIILVAVTVTMAVNGGLFGHAQSAARQTNEQRNLEQELGKGKINIAGQEYNSPQEYVDTITKNDEKIETVTCSVCSGTKKVGTGYICDSCEKYYVEQAIVGYEYEGFCHLTAEDGRRCGFCLI